MSSAKLPLSVDPSLLFAYHCRLKPTGGLTAAELDASFSLPPLASLQRRPTTIEVDCRVGWSPNSLAVRMVSPAGRMADAVVNSRIVLYVDSRGSVGNLRLTDFCSQLQLRPNLQSGGTAEMFNRANGRWVSSQHPVQIISRRDGQQLSVAIDIPAAALPGYQPEAFPEISLYYELEDAAGGRHAAVGGIEIRQDLNPSLWIRCRMAKA